MAPVGDPVMLEMEQRQLGFSAVYTILFLMGNWIFVWLQEVVTKLLLVE